MPKRNKDWNLTVQEGQDNYAIQIDEIDANTIYIGRAEEGTLSADPYWQIKKISIVGTVTSILWADGDDNFDNVWNNRASLSYS